MTLPDNTGASGFGGGVTGFRNLLTVLANKIISLGTGGGIFVYNGTPASGTLVANITPTAGVDGYSNPYFTTVGTYSGNAAGSTYALLSSGRVRFGLVGDGGVASGGSINLLTSPLLQLQFGSPEPFAFTNDINVATGQYLQACTDTQGQTPDTWHSLGDPGITGVTMERAQYRFSPLGNGVEYDILFTTTAAMADQNGTAFPNNLPTAYQPAAIHAYPIGVDKITVGALTNNWPCVQVSRTGPVSLFLPAAASATHFSAQFINYL